MQHWISLYSMSHLRKTKIVTLSCSKMPKSTNVFPREKQEKAKKKKNLTFFSNDDVFLGGLLFLLFVSL